MGRRAAQRPWGLCATPPLLSHPLPRPAPVGAVCAGTSILARLMAQVGMVLGSPLGSCSHSRWERGLPRGCWSGVCPELPSESGSPSWLGGGSAGETGRGWSQAYRLGWEAQTGGHMRLVVVPALL